MEVSRPLLQLLLLLGDVVHVALQLGQQLGVVLIQFPLLLGDLPFCLRRRPLNSALNSLHFRRGRIQQGIGLPLQLLKALLDARLLDPPLPLLPGLLVNRPANRLAQNLAHILHFDQHGLRRLFICLSEALLPCANARKPLD